MSGYVAELCDNGVHVKCSRKRCKLAGKVERVHGHDYDGDLVCGCDEYDMD